MCGICLVVFGARNRHKTSNCYCRIAATSEECLRAESSIVSQFSVDLLAVFSEASFGG